jgi:DNA-directed RNA polymerase
MSAQNIEPAEAGPSDLFLLEEKLEAEAVARGVTRYHAAIASRTLADVPVGLTLRGRALGPTAAAITKGLGGRGRPRVGAGLVRGVDSEILAELTMRSAINGAAEHATLTATARTIGEAVEHHVRDTRLHEVDPVLWRRKQEALNTTRKAQFRRRSIDGTVRGRAEYYEREGREEDAARMHEVMGLAWTNEEHIDAGLFLFDCFAKATSLVWAREVHEGGRSPVRVRFVAKTEQWLKAQHEYREVLRPVYLPMVVEPEPWVSMREGGYLNNEQARQPFMKQRWGWGDAEAVGLFDFSAAMVAVNAVQATAWRVNRRVYDVMRTAWDRGQRLGDVWPKEIDETTEAPLEALPAAWKAANGDVHPERRKTAEYKRWAARRAKAHKYNAELPAAVKNFGVLMRAAGEYLGLGEPGTILPKRDTPYTFWHVHNLDWRGRSYTSASSVLSPQGDQFHRGLIEFANGRRMGDDEKSGAWLAIHGANCWANGGLDKATFDERIAWVTEHSEHIKRVVEDDPLSTESKAFWLKADGGAKAWPFLAFCYEWAGYMRDGDEHRTHLPIGLDGSNSGLQHLSAMMRDANGAKATNVAANEEPEDVYMELCEIVAGALTSVDDPWAGIWLAAGIDRKICKQPTMTYVYGATAFGAKGQIEAALDELDRKAQNEGRARYLERASPQQTNREAAEFLLPRVRDALKVRLPKAAIAMQFIQDCCDVASAAGYSLQWQTPAGVPVMQSYPKMVEGTKKARIEGRDHQLSIPRKVRAKRIELGYEVDKKGARDGAVPNYVHGMDGTHLLWTAESCKEHGITDLALIHDSFGTHAARTDLLAEILRAQFVRLYTPDRLAEFRSRVAGRLPAEVAAKLPPVPEKGSFDIEEVRRSQYFFA